MVGHKTHYFLYQKRGFFYYSRRIPKELLCEYRKKRIVLALKTRCRREAQALSKKITYDLDALWIKLKIKNISCPAQELLLSYRDDLKLTPTLSEALESYLALKGGKGDNFAISSRRIVDEAIRYIGDMNINKYSRRDANMLRDKLLDRGLAPQSIKRKYNTISSIFNFAIIEHSVDCNNVFSKVIFGDISPVQKRASIPQKDIINIQKTCVEDDNQNSWLVALISDTGMRLSEALGIELREIHLSGSIPFIDIKPNSCRTLKTKSSERKIPLVGKSLWAAERIANASNAYAFPKYSSLGICKANSASARINKWLSKQVSGHYVIHGFRHSLRDRLRAVQCPADVVDQIGGWSNKGGVGNQYGDGYQLDVLHEWLIKIKLQH